MPPWVKAWVLLALDTLVLVVQVLVHLVVVDVPHGTVQVLAAMVNAVKEVVRPTAMRELRGEVGRTLMNILGGAQLMISLQISQHTT